MNAISSFHTHTYRCKHASGTPADYIAQAVKDGCSELGFSDHCPFPAFLPDFWPEVRMSADEAPDYMADVRKAAESAPFPVHAGFECEFDPRVEFWYRDFLKGEMGADYLVLGQHWFIEDGRHPYIPGFKTVAQLHSWTDTTIRGMETGLFKFLAHPDVLMGGQGIDWSKEIEACLKAILEAAMSCDMPVEINGYGLIKEPVPGTTGIFRQPYPVDQFWEIVATSGARVICNSDAHSPAAVISSARKARDYAAKFGITPIDTIF